MLAHFQERGATFKTKRKFFSNKIILVRKMFIQKMLGCYNMIIIGDDKEEINELKRKLFQEFEL